MSILNYGLPSSDELIDDLTTSNPSSNQLDAIINAISEDLAFTRLRWRVK
jgi:hypothetical protein